MDTEAREQRQRLERIAFGRTHGQDDEDAAAAARKELAEAGRAAELSAARAAAAAAVREADPGGREALASQEPGAGSWSLAATLAGEELPPPPPEVPRKNRHRIHPAWLVPIIAGSIAAGYFGAMIAAAGAPQSPVTVTASDESSTVRLVPTPEPPSDVAIPVRAQGNLKEADAWFEAPQREVDGFIHPDMLHTMQIDPATTRFVQTNSAGFAAWVARKLNGDLCVLGTDASGGAFAACSSRDDFERSGAMISQSDFTISWNGSAVTVTNPRSQITP